MKKTTTHSYGLCIRNDDCDDLELRKVYAILPDAKAQREGFVRVLDESGDSYLYPESFFIALSLPQRTQKTLLALAS